MEITKLRDELERTEIVLMDYIRNTPDHLFYRKRGPTTWSVAEAIHHMCLVNESLTTRLRHVLDESHGTDLTPGESEVSIRDELDALDPQWVLENVPASASSQPSNDRAKSEMSATVQEDYEKIKTLMKAGIEHDLRQVSAAHKMFGSLSYYEWLYFIVVHARTHFFQIERELGYFERTKE